MPEEILSPEMLDQVRRVGQAEIVVGVPSFNNARFHLPDELWVRLICDFAAAHHARKIHPQHLLRSLTPVYMGRVASFVVETRDSTAHGVEMKIERLCQLYEQWKPYLIEQWEPSAAPPAAPQEASAQADLPLAQGF